MKILHGLEELSKPLERSILTIGNFDGVHLAHQQLLSQAGLFSAQTGAPVVVLTFDPHPLSIVAPHKVPEKLSTLPDRLALLAQHGAQMTVVARSEPSLLSMEAERFVEEILHQKFRPTHIVEGPSFGFGKGRRGNAELLAREAAQFGCAVHIVDPVRLTLGNHQAVLVSSSLIRDLLRDGHVRRAAMCLGRNYSFTGTVEGGDRRGRELGFPTANLGAISQVVPYEGVYVGYAFVEERRWTAAISIGRSPTFDGQQLRVEAHLLGFNGDLYGKTVRVEFSRFLRSQRKFDSKDDLIAQLKIDVQAARTDEDESVNDGADPVRLHQ